MEKNKKLILAAVLLGILILTWAPWMNEKKIHDKIFEQKTKIDGTIDKQTGELICDYNVIWFPFGRMVGSCEGGYFVTFWGKIL